MKNLPVASPHLGHVSTVLRRIMRYYILYGLVLIACALTSMWNMHRYEGDTGWVIHTLAVENTAQKLLGLMSDAETGERGFLLTGSEDYLQPYDEAVRNVLNQKQLLRIMTQDNPKEQAYLDQLDLLIANRLERLEATIATQRSKGGEAARALIKTGVGKRQMDAIRHVIDDMLSEEHTLLIYREARMLSSISWGKLSFLIMFGLSCLALGCLYWQVRGAMMEREKNFDERMAAREAILEKTDTLATALSKGNRTLTEITDEAQTLIGHIRTLADGLVPKGPTKAQ